MIVLLSNLFVCTYLSAYASISLSLYLHRPVARGPPPPPSCRPAVRRPAVHRPANHRLVRHPPPPRAFCPPSAADRHRPPCRTRPWGRISSRRPAIQRPWVATVAVSCSAPPLKSVLGREKPWAKSYGLALDKNFCSVPAPPIPIPPSDRLGRLPLPWGDQSQRVFSSVLGHTGHVSH